MRLCVDVCVCDIKILIYIYFYYLGFTHFSYSFLFHQCFLFSHIGNTHIIIHRYKKHMQNQGILESFRLVLSFNNSEA